MINGSCFEFFILSFQLVKNSIWAALTEPIVFWLIAFEEWVEDRVVEAAEKELSILTRSVSTELIIIRFD